MFNAMGLVENRMGSSYSGVSRALYQWYTN